MAIDIGLLIAAPMLQDYLVDKDSGQPLSSGIITCYHDNSRLTYKNWYHQTGIPGSYSYIPLPNPLTLSAVGTVQDNAGNDVIPFFYPYDEDDSDVADPYYIVVESEGGIRQFTRENFPFVAPASSSDPGQQTLINLMPNGQFAAHNDLPNDGVFPNGQTTFVIAQGGSAGWYFQKPNTSTDRDVITFNEITQEPQNLTGNPRFTANFACTSSTGSDTAKTLRMRFNNVNRFSSDTQFYTFGFNGINNNSGTVNVSLQIYKFFGSSGSSAVTETIQTFTLENNTYTQFSTSFVFGLNSSYTIDGGDDYLELVISLPNNSVYDLALTDFILTPGSITLDDYPERPDNMVFANGIAGSMPTPAADGSDLYLPLILTPAGVTFDHSCIGDIIGNVTATAVNNKLPCDGTTYSTSGYSSLNIPYSRLQSVLLAAGNQNVPLYGTGSTFATGYINQSNGNYLRLTTNQPGSETGAADSVSAPTGFSFSNIHTGQTTGVIGYSNGSDSVLVIDNVAGSTTAPNAHTSGFTISQIVNNSVSYTKFQIVTIGAGTMVAGSYFTFSTTTTNYYMWFTIDGVGVDPAPGGTAIPVNLLSTYSAQEVANCVREAISGYQVSLIQCNAANTLTSGDFWTFNANSVTYSIWYSINGGGTAPAMGTTIRVSLEGTETNDEVAELTQIAINSYSFAVPDFRGMFLRGLRDSGQFDLGSSSRYSDITAYYGNNIGTFELDTNLSHIHSASTSTSGTVPAADGAGGTPATFARCGNTPPGTTLPITASSTTTVAENGSFESQPVNAAVTWFIRY